jgi:hypothetical protein
MQVIRLRAKRERYINADTGEGDCNLQPARALQLVQQFQSELQLPRIRVVVRAGDLAELRA